MDFGQFHNNDAHLSLSLFLAKGIVTLCSLLNEIGQIDYYYIIIINIVVVVMNNYYRSIICPSAPATDYRVILT